MQCDLMLWHTFAHSLGPMSALVSMIGGGVFDRFPGVRVASVEQTMFSPRDATSVETLDSDVDPNLPLVV